MSDIVFYVLLLIYDHIVDVLLRVIYIRYIIVADIIVVIVRRLICGVYNILSEYLLNRGMCVRNARYVRIIWYVLSQQLNTDISATTVETKFDDILCI